MIIWGWKTRITKAAVEDILAKSCPHCNGDLELSDLKKWFTLYFIPIFPFSTIETLYKCQNCGNTYKQEIKKSLKNSDRKNIEKEVRKMFATTLAACLVHMAKADGKITKEEKDELKRLSNNFKEFKTDIDKTVQKITSSKNNEEVFLMLQKARQVLTAEGIMLMIAQIARMLLADGKIDKNEEKLMKEYMLICGLPRNLFQDMISKVKANMK